MASVLKCVKEKGVEEVECSEPFLQLSRTCRLGLNYTRSSFFLVRLPTRALHIVRNEWVNRESTILCAKLIPPAIEL